MNSHPTPTPSRIPPLAYPSLVLLVSIIALILIRPKPKVAELAAGPATSSATSGIASNQAHIIPKLPSARSAIPSAVEPTPAEALQNDVLQLRAKPHWQYRPSAETFALQAKLLELKALGLKRSALQPDVLPDALDFLSPTRRAGLDPRVEELADQLQAMDWDLLGDAWEGPHVDAYQALQKEFLNHLRQELSPEELAEYAARHSPSAQRLREQRLDLSEDQFRAVAAAEFDFDTADVSTEDLETLAALGRERDQRLTEVLGEDGLARYQRSLLPTYEASVDAAEALGMSAPWGDWLFRESEWVREVRVLLWDQDGLTPAEREAAEREFTATSRQRIAAALGPEHFTTWYQSPAAVWLREEGDPLPTTPTNP